MQTIIAKELLKKITSKKAKVGIVGMGYVGSALSDLTISSGFTTIGFVRAPEKAVKINNQKKKKLSGTTDRSLLASCDIIAICVQTPIHEDKTPDLRFLEDSLTQVSSYLRTGQLAIIESSISVGTTRAIALPILEKSKLKAEKDFYLAFSPERVDPGNKQFKLGDIPKVVAGLDTDSKALITAFYSKVFKKVVQVSSLEAAEMTKLLENTFRLINISLINELKCYTDTLGIDMYEIVNAAATKPFGFLAHYPGPGIGGHCIPVDPYYLLDDAKKRGVELKLLEQAGKINDSQPIKVVEKTLEILKHKNKGAKILLVGISYKPDIDDTRESPAFKIWELLQSHGFSVSYHDPYVPRINGFFSEELSAKAINEHDLIIIITNHSNINYEVLHKSKKLILDTRNVFNGLALPNVYRI